jgi:hypothetical protein
MFTFAMPQSLPAAERNFSALSRSFVKIALESPCGTPLLTAIASSTSATSISYNSGANVSS